MDDDFQAAASKYYAFCDKKSNCPSTKFMSPYSTPASLSKEVCLPQGQFQGSSQRYAVATEVSSYTYQPSPLSCWCQHRLMSSFMDWLYGYTGEDGLIQLNLTPHL